MYLHTHIEAEPVEALHGKYVAINADDVGPLNADGGLGTLNAHTRRGDRTLKGCAGHTDQAALAAILEDG